MSAGRVRADAGARAIVVLGAAVRPGGRAGPALLRRVRHGVAAWRASPDTLLVLTGGEGRHPPAEAVVMGEIARGLGVPADRIVLESRAADTFESARNCATALRALGIDRVIVVSDAWHLPRALLAFRAFGIDARGWPAGPADPAPSGRRLHRGAREAVGTLWYLLRIVGHRLAARR